MNEMPPISKKASEFHFPDFELITLNNGIKVYKYEYKLLPLANFKIINDYGIYNEDIFGQGSFANGLMMRGNKNLSSEALAEEIDFMGASMGKSASWDFSMFNISSLSEFSEKSMNILLDSYQFPLFDEKEMERLRKTLISRLKEEQSEPQYLAKMSFNAELYGDHPYSHSLLGNLETLKSIDQAACKSWHERLLGIKPAFILSGNMDFDNAIKIIEERFSDYKFGGSKRKEVNAEFKSKNKFVLTEKPDSVQSTIRAGRLVMDRHDPDFAYLALANTIFGGYFQSRINMKLREEKGLTYGIYSAINARSMATELSIGADLNLESSKEAVNDILFEMEQIAHAEIKQEEFEIAKQYILGSFVRKIETTQQITQFIQSMEIYDLDKNYFEDYFNKIAKAKLSDLDKVRSENLKPENMVISLSGDINFLEKEFADRGVSIYNSEAKKIK